MATKSNGSKFKTLTSDLSLTRQAVILTEQVSIQVGELIHKLRIEIKSDSYDFQSWAKISVWKADGLMWSLLDSIPYGSMKTPHQLYSHFRNQQHFDQTKIGTRASFDNDVKELQRRALLILM